MKNGLILSSNVLIDYTKLLTKHKYKKRLLNNLLQNLKYLKTLKNKSSYNLNTSIKFQSNILNNIYNLNLFVLKKIKPLKTFTSKNIVQFYYISFYNLFNHVYFLSDTRFKNFWDSNLFNFFIIFYRAYIYLLTSNKLLLLTHFNLQIFNRFKKSRRRFFTYFLSSKSLNEFSLSLIQPYNINTKLTSFIYMYWTYLKLFLFTKTSTYKTINKKKLVTILLLCNIYYNYNLSYKFNYKVTDFSKYVKPLFYLNLFINFLITTNIFKIKLLVSRRRRFRRFIFKKIKQSRFLFSSVRYIKIKKHYNFILQYFKSFIITFSLISCYYLFSISERLFTFFRVYKLRFKSAKKFSRKKKRNLRRRFFFVKRSKRHNIHRYFKCFRLKKTLFRTKLLVSSKLTFLNNFKRSFSFLRTFLLSTSTKITILFILLFLNRFRRFIPRILFLFNNLYNTDTLFHLSSTLNTFGKWSNVVPFFYLSKPIKLLINSKKSRLNHYDYLLYLRQIMGGFLESLTQKKIFLKINTKLRIKKKIKYSLFFLYKKHRNYQNSIGRGFFFNEMLFVCWYSLFSKDLQFLMSWLTRAMCRMEIRKHRKFIKIFKMLFSKYKSFFLRLNKVKGVKLDIRGKLGVKGNAKKRHLSFNVNTTSFSKKKNRLDYRQGLVYTETGVLGVTLILTY